MLINETDFYKLLDKNQEKNKDFIEIIKETSNAFEEHTQQCTLFKNFTDHTLEHSINIINYMWKLSPMPTELNSRTIFYLIMAALCHDFGLLVTKDDETDIKNNKYITNQQQSYAWESVKKYLILNNLSDSTDKIENKAYQLIARNLHTNEEVIRKKITKLCEKSNYRMSNEMVKNLTLICHAHGADPIDIEKQLRENDIFFQENSLDEHVDFGFVISLLRLGDILDIGVNRVHSISKEYNNFDKENLRHEEINLLIQKVGINYETTDFQNCAVTEKKNYCPRYPKKISLIFNNEATMSGENLNYLFSYIQWIETEIENADKYFLRKHLNVNQYGNKYRFATMLAIYPIVEKVNFPKETEFRLIEVDKSSIIDWITSESLYPQKEIFLREIIQNAIDACNFYSKISGESDYQPKVRIELNQNYFVIEDNGIGMTYNILINYYLKIGSSYYNSNEYQLSENQFSHAGHFGVGAYSVFLVSDDVTIETKRNSEILKVEYEKSQNYVKINRNLHQNQSSFHSFGHGTKICLRLKEEFKKNLEDNKINKYIYESFLKNPKIILNLKYLNTDININDCLKSLDEWCLNMNIDSKKQVKKLDDYFDGIECRCVYNKVKNINLYYNLQKNCFDKHCNYDVGQEVIVYSYENNDQTYNYIKKGIESSLLEHEELRVFEGTCIEGNIKFVDLNIPINAAIKINNAKIVQINNQKSFINSALCSSYSGCSLFSKTNIFLHNIRINNADLNLNLLPNIKIHSCAMNITNPIVIPTISRDNIPMETLKKIREALLYAILKDLNLKIQISDDSKINPFIRGEKYD